MDKLIEGLALVEETAIGTLLHIGAGDGGTLEALQGRQVLSQVLVEGDPETAAELRERVGGRSDVRVLASAVAAAPGVLRWHRYNLRKLNGPVDAVALADVYPRLRELEQLDVPVRGLADVVAEVAARMDGRLPGVLILDTPGQSEVLLASLPEATLLAFDWIVTMACSALPEVGGEANRARLQALCFNARSAAEADAMWPVSVWRFDRQAHAQQRARVQQDALLAQLAATRQQVEALRADTAQLVEQRADLQARLAESTAQAAQMAHHGQGLEQALATAVQTGDEADAQARALQQRLDQQARALDEQTRLAADRDAQLQQLNRVRAQLETAASAHQVQQQELAARLAEAVAARASAESRQTQAADEAEAARAALQQQVAASTHGLEEQARLAEARQAALHEQQSACAGLEAAMAEQKETHIQLAEQLRKQEQALAAATEATSQARAQGEALQQRLDEQGRALDEQTRLAGGRYTQLQTLNRQKTELEAGAAAHEQAFTQMTADLDALRAQREADAQALAEAQARHAALEAQEMQQAQRLAELAQVHSQLEAQAATAGEELAALQETLQAQAASLEEQTRLAGARYVQIQSLNQAKTALDKALAERGQQVAAAQQEASNAAAAAAEALHRSEAECEQQRALAQSLKAAADQLSDELPPLRVEREQWLKDKSTLTSARDEQSKLARDAKQRSTQLDAELAEVAARHGLLQEELIKAEAQIEFIADLLLREPRG